MFFDSLAAQFNEPAMLEALRRRAVAPVGQTESVASGLAPDQDARYAANSARRLGLPGFSDQRSGVGGQGAGVGDRGSEASGREAMPDQEARYAANVVKRLGPPAVSGPAPDAVEAMVSGSQPDGIVGPPAFRPQLVQRPPEPTNPAEHPAVKKRLAQLTDPLALSDVERARTLLAPPTDSIPLQPSATPNQPIEDRRLFPTDVTEPAARYASNVARRLGTRSIAEQHGILDDTPPALPEAGHGFLAHLKSALEGLGAGLATGHPLAGAIMGVAGGVKPQLGANAWYNNVTLPRWEAHQGQALELAAKRLAIGKSVADLTGVDLFTGEPSYAARQAEMKSDLADQIAQATAAHRKTLEDISRQREMDMAEVARGNLNIKEAIAREKVRTDQAMEGLRQQLLKIQQQNADANTLRANKAGQPRTSITNKIWGANPDHAAWVNERDAARKQNPGASDSDLIQGKRLRKEPAAQIQTGSTTTKGASKKSTQRPEAALAPDERQRRYQASVNATQAKTDLTDEQKAAMIKRFKTKYGIK